MAQPLAKLRNALERARAARVAQSLRWRSCYSGSGTGAQSRNNHKLLQHNGMLPVVLAARMRQRQISPALVSARAPRECLYNRTERAYTYIVPGNGAVRRARCQMPHAKWRGDAPWRHACGALAPAGTHAWLEHASLDTLWRKRERLCKKPARLHFLTLGIRLACCHSGVTAAALLATRRVRPVPSPLWRIYAVRSCSDWGAGHLSGTPRCPLRRCAIRLAMLPAGRATTAAAS